MNDAQIEQTRFSKVTEKLVFRVFGQPILQQNITSWDMPSLDVAVRLFHSHV